MKTYPLSDFVKRELAVTLNTDNPAISSTTIANEFAYAQSLGITLAQEEKMHFNRCRCRLYRQGYKR